MAHTVLYGQDMNQNLYVRRRRRRTAVPPALLLASLALLLFAGACVGFLTLRVFANDWLSLKLDSLHYHIVTLLPQADHPDFVPTPAGVADSSTVPTIAWTVNIASATPTAKVVKQVATADQAAVIPVTQTPMDVPAQQATDTPEPSPTIANLYQLSPIQPAVELKGVIQEAQRFNNCGPTTLRMYLSYFGYTQASQVQIANVLKPNTDDKNVSPNELVGYADNIGGFKSLYRINGTIDRIKQTLSNGIPIMIEEGYDPPRAHEGWMGHYLLLTGYDAQGITAQDSYDGPNQRVAWQLLDDHWRNFNRTYILLYTPKQEAMVQALVGEDMDDATMYAKAAQRAQDEWNANPQDPFAPFNLGSSLVGLGEYDAAAHAFDQARVRKLPWRMLWYQFGPYEAYYHVGRYNELIALSDATQHNVNDLEESYYYKGLALQKLGRNTEARSAFELALKYNPNYIAAQQALASLAS